MNIAESKTGAMRAPERQIHIACKGFSRVWTLEASIDDGRILNFSYTFLAFITVTDSFPGGG